MCSVMVRTSWSILQWQGRLKRTAGHEYRKFGLEFVQTHNQEYNKTDGFEREFRRDVHAMIKGSEHWHIKVHDNDCRQPVAMYTHRGHRAEIPSRHERFVSARAATHSVVDVFERRRQGSVWLDHLRVAKHRGTFRWSARGSGPLS